MQEYLKDNIIIVCENDYKKCILKKLTLDSLFLNIKFYSKKEFITKYLLSYKDEAIYYLINKYHYKIDIIKMYLKNIYYIDETKAYKSNKLNKLVTLKNELIENNLIEYDLSFKDSIKGKEIYIMEYPYLESYEEDVFNRVNAKKIENTTFYKHNKVYVFKTAYEEIIFVAKMICKLLKNNINIKNIKIINKDNNYNEILSRIFKFYNIPLKIDSNNYLYNTKVAYEFIKYYESDIEKTISKIKHYDYNILNKIINICNKYTYTDDYLKVKELIINDLKSVKVNDNNLQNYVEITSLDNLFTDEDYVFVIGFNMGNIPSYIKDEDYITDNIKSELNAKSVLEINREIKNYTITKLNNIKNLFISYKLKENGSDVFASSLVYDMNLEEEIYEENILESYSKVLDKISYAKELDLYRKYGSVSNKLLIYQNTFKDILYNSYDNKFTGIEKTNLNKILNNKLVLSYSSLDTYNKCAFRYYIKNILHLDKYEENFEAFIGSLFHNVLEKCFNNNLDVLKEVEDYIKQSGKNLSSKERFFVNKITYDIIFVIDVIKKQYEHISLDKALYEKNIVINKDRDIPVEFTGYIDKILYKEFDNKVIVSIIDYKTGYVDIDLKNTMNAINMQLPIYLYLVKKSEIFKNPKFAGFYLQYILDKDILRNNKSTYLKERCNNLKLVGYSCDDGSILECFDDTYENSEIIKSMKVKADGSFSSFAKVLNERQINNLINITEKIIDNAISDILDCHFEINPKKLGYDNDIGCKYCKFKDICFRKEEDYKILNPNDNLDFLGGEENAEMD